MEESVRILAIEWLELNSRIKNQEILNFTIDGLLYAKEEFFSLPASSSGKYHPSYALGVGGLLRHTKAAITIAEELFPLYDFDEITQDYIIAALTLHDIEKPSRTHPVEVKFRLEPLRDDYPDIFEKVISLIETHHGQWDHFGRFPRPQNTAQEFVHLADYLASRKSLTVEI